ncbi:hypothetical protein K504DRAFT_242625 [Pleomassaria siparia CBS 279.74]|uniref:Uncharacterized protein n=1 Tax=Pleomassaria siparia CBS 279.74 TaxID=1314801 RepID=A0A6G1KF01_9PLEO|nr:hypothetical protein K504DRAFT_242625 [Pleomassaria siparia CBS 279.74]
MQAPYQLGGGACSEAAPARARFFPRWCVRAGVCGYRCGFWNEQAKQARNVPCSNYHLHTVIPSIHNNPRHDTTRHDTTRPRCHASHPYPASLLLSSSSSATRCSAVRTITMSPTPNPAHSPAPTHHHHPNPSPPAAQSPNPNSKRTSSRAAAPVVKRSTRHRRRCSSSTCPRAWWSSTRTRAVGA